MATLTIPKQESSLEELYSILFRIRQLGQITEPEEGHSLEQPSFYKIVRIFTTYGAYEDPI